MFLEWVPTGTVCEVCIEIGVSGFHRRASVVIHEMAHYVAAVAYGFGSTAPHGVEFATIIVNLWSHYLGATPARLRRQAAGFGVRFAQ